MFLLLTLASAEQYIKLEEKTSYCRFIFRFKSVNCSCQFLTTLRTKYFLTGTKYNLLHNLDCMKKVNTDIIKFDIINPKTPLMDLDQ